MGVRQQVIYETIEEFRKGIISRSKAAWLLSISERSVSRLARRIAANGMAGILHGNKGRSPVNRLPADVSAQVIALLKDRYFDFSLAHAWEKIRDEHLINIKYRSLINLAHEAKLRPQKTRRPSKARMNRERFANRGMLLQMDGSHHKWNGVDEWCLIAIIDDASSELEYARFETSETTWACLNALRSVVSTKGIPHFIYADRAGWANQASPKRAHFSQFVRACKELGITVIPASSPEAKGRIERANKTMQARLVPEFRLHGVKTITHANQYMEQCFKPEWQKKFTVQAQHEESRYRVLNSAFDLGNIFCLKHKRIVANDNCVYFAGKNIQILPGSYGNMKKKQITVHEYESGDYRLFYGQVPLNHQEFKRNRHRRYLRAG